MNTRRKTLVLTPMISRVPKQARAPPLQKHYERPTQKVEDIGVTDVFTYTPDKSLSKEKIKYVVSRTVNRNMLVAVELLKELKNTNGITSISGSDLESLVIKPLDKFLDGRVLKRQQDRVNPFDVPRDVTTSFTRLLDILKRQGIDVTSIKVEGGQSSLSSSSKLLRMYISNNLERNGKQIILDPILEGLFSEEDTQELYSKNGGEFITQGQIQKLASLLVTKST